ncbi:MAG: hypothetical protein DWP97_04820 [Calditrichaeota bacterium]|nr:MAG: hypothetical protein DWP97_04820 [Calditrichota bacterium]
MKIKLLACLLVFLFALPLIAAPPLQQGKLVQNNSASVDNTTLIDINRILMFVTNHGNFGRDLSGLFGHDYGTWYPFTGDTSDYHTGVVSNYTPNYASGLWVGAIDSASGDTLTTISEYSSEYVPGPMSGGTFLPDSPNYRVFKLWKDSLKNNPSVDYQDYLTYAVPDQGAPVWKLTDGALFVDSLGDSLILSIDSTATPPDTVELGYLNDPQVIGDQFLWSVYNDADPAQHANIETAPLGIEVKQSIYGFKRDDPLGDIVFMRYRIYNKGNKTLENCYMSIWADPDLGSSGDDFVGCDTLEGLGFVWNDNVIDANYDPNPVPAMGFDFLQGPLVAKTESGQPDGKMWGQVYTDSTNLGMTSFNKYINGTDPDDEFQVYNYMRGLTRDGQDYTYNGQVLRYVLSGDPVSGQGDIDVASADRRWMQSTGPVTFRPGDSTEIYAAMILGQAIDNKVSISLLRYHDRFAQLTYDNDWRTIDPPAPPVLTSYKDENSISIGWTDTSEVDPGTYAFEGYAVFQGSTPNGPWKKITTFDYNNTIEDVFDETFNPNTASFEIVKVVDGDNFGIKRYLTITEDVINGGEIINLTEYHYRVEAYGVNVDAPLGLQVTRASATISVTPELKVPDIVYDVDPGDVLEVTHTAGVSDGVISPIVVNPQQLTGHTYRIEFADTLGIVVDTTQFDPINDPDSLLYDSINVAWHLYDVTDGVYKLMWQTNQSGDDSYLTIDGFTVKVAGPAAGFKSFEVVQNGAGAIDPPDPGAFSFQDFPTPGDGNPTDAQQVGDGHWGFHTADNGGTNDGGTRGSYAAFLERVMRNDNAEDVGIYDFEMRFTAGTHYAVGAFENAPEPIYTVPFELWRIGISTPNDPSDDVRMLPWMIDADASNTYNLQGWGDSNNGAGDYEHSASSANNDPQTDWVYWILPADDSPGEAGYNADVATFDMGNMNVGTYAFDGEEVMARTVLVNWNGGSEPPFNQDLPEEGTVFRLITGKPNSSSDVFTFSTPAPSALASKSEELLDKIVAVPNPFYLSSTYNDNPGSYTLKFYHLPTECTITIYNLAGEYIQTIDKNDPNTSVAEWDILTENGLPVSSGIYIYVVDAPGYGQKIGKMAIFVQQEVLQIY